MMPYIYGHFPRRLISLIFGMLLCVGAPLEKAQAQSCTRFLNATEGDDGNAGNSRSSAVKSFEHAFLTFPSGSVVCTTAGEYISGLDSDGIQLSGANAQGKEMRFILESFGGETSIRFTEDEFRVDIGTGKLTFAAGSARSLTLGQGEFNSPSRFPSNTNFLHTLALISGSVDATGVDLRIGSSVGNPSYIHPTSGRSASDAAIIRGIGTIAASNHFSADPRVLRYVDSGDRTSGDEVPPTITRLQFEHQSGTVEASRPLSFSPGATISSTSSGSVLVSTAVHITSASSGAIVSSGTGDVHFSQPVRLELASDASGVIQNLGTVSLEFANLQIGLSDSVDRNLSASLVNQSSGVLILRQVDQFRNTPGRSASLVVENSGQGSLVIGRPEAATVISVDEIRNSSAGAVSILSESSVSGVLVNRGHAVLDQGVALQGAFQNVGQTTLEGDVELHGGLQNTGTIHLDGHVLTLASAEPHTNDGVIRSQIEGGYLHLIGTVEVSGTGILPDIQSESGSHTVSAAAIEGDILLFSNGTLTVVRSEYVGGEVIATGGILRLPTTSIRGNLLVEGGSVELTGDVSILNSFLESAGSMDLAGHELRVDGAFVRSDGEFKTSGGALVFRGSEIQTFQAGPDLILDELRVEGTSVAVSGYPISVNQKVVIRDESELLLSDYELRLIGASAMLLNDGEISTSITGEIEFSGPAGSAQILSGAGLNGNLTIALQDEYDSIIVAGSEVTQTGILSLIRGGVSVAEGATLTFASDQGRPLIRRNLGDANGDGAPDAKGIRANEPGLGLLRTPTNGYDLEYFGTIGGRSVSGAEFLSGGIVDLRIAIEGLDGVPAVLELSDDLSFTGNLTLNSGAVLDLGTSDLTAAAIGGNHTVSGLIDATSGRFVVAGSGRIRGVGGSVPGSIQNVLVSSTGLVEISSLFIPGSLEITSGVTSLQYLSDSGVGYESAGNLGSLFIRGGLLNLSDSVEIVDSLVATGGQVSLGEQNLVMGDGSAFTMDALASIVGEGAIVWSGDGSMETGEAIAQRIIIDAGSDANVSLTGKVKIGQSLIHHSGNLDLGAFDLVHEGRLWEFHGGSYSGNGRVILRGSIALLLYDDIRVPNLSISGTTAQAVVTIGGAEENLHKTIVEENLRLVQGTIHLDRQDLVVEGGLFYENGTITGTGDLDFADDSAGELVLSGADVNLSRELTVPYLRIRADSRIDDNSASLRVSEQIAFESGTLSFTEAGDLILAANSRVVRSGPGTFSRRPVTEGSLTVAYFSPSEVSEGVLSTGAEIPLGTIAEFIVDSGPNIVRLQESVSVSEMLQIRSGLLSPGSHELSLGPGSTVHLDFSGVVEPGFADAGYSATGPISLIFSGSTGDLLSTDLSFPTTAAVESLIVRMKDGHLFSVHDLRRVGGVIVQSDTGAGFNLNGKTLFVQGQFSVESGIVTSEQQALLTIEGDLLISESAAVEGVISATVQGDSKVEGAFEAYLLRTYGDVDVSGRLGGPRRIPDAQSDFYEPGIPSLRFLGANQALRFSNSDESARTVDDALNTLTIDLRDSVSTVRIESSGDPLTLGVNSLVLERGLLVTGENDVRLPGNGIGYARKEGALSHVVGSVSRQVLAGQPNPFTIPFADFDFPVGSGGLKARYRPASISFSVDNPASVTSVLRVSAHDSSAGGYLGFPIDGGDGVLLDDDSNFYWSISASPALPAGQILNIGVVGTGYSSFTAARNLRIIRRTGEIPWESEWALQGNPAGYDNAVVKVNGISAPLVQSLHATSVLKPDPAIFAIGIEAEALPFARVQFVNLLSVAERISIMANDSLLARGVSPGRATAYVPIGEGPQGIVLSTGENTLILSDTLAVEAGKDYVLLAMDTREGPSMVLVDSARATPTLPGKNGVSFGFVNLAAGVASLTVQNRDTGAPLADAILYGQMAEPYVVLEPADVGFNLLSSSTIIGSYRADVSDEQGLTILALAYDPDSRDGDDIDLLLVDNHGRVLSSRVQVATEEIAVIPDRFSLHGNYPNPFNPSTSVVFDLPEASEVTVEVYDLLGREMMSVRGGTMAAGSRRSIQIDGSRLASGMYLYRVIADAAEKTQTASGTMTLVK